MYVYEDREISSYVLTTEIKSAHTLFNNIIS